MTILLGLSQPISSDLFSLWTKLTSDISLRLFIVRFCISVATYFDKVYRKTLCFRQVDEYLQEGLHYLHSWSSKDLHVCVKCLQGHIIIPLTNFYLFSGRWLWKQETFFIFQVLVFLCWTDKKKVVIQSSELKARQTCEVQQDRKTFQSEGEDLDGRKIVYQVHLPGLSSI